MFLLLLLVLWGNKILLQTISQYSWYNIDLPGELNDSKVANYKSKYNKDDDVDVDGDAGGGDAGYVGDLVCEAMFWGILWASNYILTWICINKYLNLFAFWF